MSTISTTVHSRGQAIKVRVRDLRGGNCPSFVALAMTCGVSEISYHIDPDANSLQDWANALRSAADELDDLPAQDEPVVAGLEVAGVE